MNFDVRPQDTLLLVASIWLVTSFIVGFNLINQAGGWLAYTGGWTMAILAAASTEQKISGLVAGLRILVGAALVAAPFALGFGGKMVAMVSFVATGVIGVGTGAMDLVGGGEQKAAA